MSEKEKQLGESIKKLLDKLPEDKQERVMGFAEGIIAAASLKKKEA